MRSFILSRVICFIFAATAAALFLLSPSAQAAAEFNHTVRIIVPATPGGTSDILARIIAPKLSEAIGQTVVVENKPGGGSGGNIGADLVAKSAKDGHVLMIYDVAMMATAPALYSNMPYDLQKDLAPVGMILFAPYVLAVHPSLPVKNVDELIAWSKANPGKVNQATSAVGAANHLAGIIVAREKGLTWKFVPYKGGAAASRAVVTGESNLIINGATATAPFVINQQMVGLAVTGKERMKTLPDVPTFREVGLPQVDAGSFQGMLTTAGTPPVVVQRLSEELRKILAMPDIQKKIEEQGGLVQSGKPEDLAAWFDENIEAYGAEIRAANLKVE
jgi:tripartite-type tricarboxylate transporter receptor subunit TctC